MNSKDSILGYIQGLGSENYLWTKDSIQGRSMLKLQPNYPRKWPVNLHPLCQLPHVSRNQSSVTIFSMMLIIAVWLSVKNLNPRACNMFYLNPLKCSKSDCEYSHEHTLSEIQLSALRYNCKKQLCRSFQQSDTCPYNDDCIYGHECPDNVGGKCTAGKKCKLMHPVN